MWRGALPSCRQRSIISLSSGSVFNEALWDWRLSVSPDFLTPLQLQIEAAATLPSTARSLATAPLIWQAGEGGEGRTGRRRKGGRRGRGRERERKGVPVVWGGAGGKRQSTSAHTVRTDNTLRLGERTTITEGHNQETFVELLRKTAPSSIPPSKLFLVSFSFLFLKSPLDFNDKSQWVDPTWGRSVEHSFVGH